MSFIVPLLLYPIIAGLEFLWSYVSEWRNVAVVTRKVLRSVACDVAANSIAWGTTIVVIMEAKNPWLSIPAIIGSAIGTFLVARRPIKKKGRAKGYDGGVPVNA